MPATGLRANTRDVPALGGRGMNAALVGIAEQAGNAGLLCAVCSDRYVNPNENFVLVFFGCLTRCDL